MERCGLDLTNKMIRSMVQILMTVASFKLCAHKVLEVIQRVQVVHDSDQKQFFYGRAIKLNQCKWSVDAKQCIDIPSFRITQNSQFFPRYFWYFPFGNILL